MKLPCRTTGRFLIGSYRPENKGSSVLLVGRFDGGRFRFAGRMAHGLKAAHREEIVMAMRGLRARRCPFVDLPNMKQDPFQENVTPEEMDSFVWLNPDVEIDVAFAEWTRFGTLRHAEFLNC